MKDLHDSYKLRYKVYCIEKKFLSSEDYVDRMEYDNFDKVSKHFYYMEEHGIQGTIRLIPWTDDKRFPTEKYFPFLLGSLGGIGYPIEMTAEISRFCISKSCFDKYAATMELFKQMYHYSRNNSITHWIATFERSLYILLKRQGFEFKLLSDFEIEYFGKVNLYGVCIEELEWNLKNKKPDLYSYFKSI